MNQPTGCFSAAFIQPSHFKVTVDALHVAQNPLPIRAVGPQHLLHRLANKDKSKQLAAPRRAGRPSAQIPRDSSGMKLNRFWLTSVCEIPTASPVLNARFRFSFCGDVQKKKEAVSHFKQICSSVWYNEIPCSRVTGCCRGCARGGRCDRRRRRRDHRPSCC